MKQLQLNKILGVKVARPVNPAFVVAKPGCVNPRLSLPARRRPASERADAAADPRKKRDIAGCLDLRRGNAVSVDADLARETGRLAKRTGRACMVENREAVDEAVR